MTRRISKEDYGDTAYGLVAGLKILIVIISASKTMKQIKIENIKKGISRFISLLEI